MVVNSGAQSFSIRLISSKLYTMFAYNGGFRMLLNEPNGVMYPHVPALYIDALVRKLI